ncbi:MAG: TrmH family RNA methyltransferase [bacterium]|nr:TrmH family RNA methyltransferase [bacterium]
MKKITYLDLIKNSPSAQEIAQRPRRPVRVVLDNVRSLYNVGSIFRSSDAAGVEKIYLCGITAKPPRAEISVPWEYFENAAEIVRDLHQCGFEIVVLEHTDQPQNHFNVKFNYPLCLVVGHEISGISAEVVALADTAIEIPMFGVKQSLNVAVAYGIAIYEIVKPWL